MNATFGPLGPPSERSAVAVYDVDGCIRSWGQRGVLSGGFFGLVLGSFFVANPLSAHALTFGTVGTLLVCIVECAVVGGIFGVVTAAFNGRGVFRGYASGLEWPVAAESISDAARFGRNDIPQFANTGACGA